MANPTFTLVALALAAGLTIATLLQRQIHARLGEENQALRAQAALRDELQRENERLTRSQPTPASSLTGNSLRELLRLRGTVARLRSESGDTATAARGSTARADLDYQAIDPESERTYGPAARGKARYGADLGRAVTEFARQHQGQFPASLAEATSLLSAEARSQTRLTSDQFELAWQGRLEDLTNPPPEATMIVREREAWRTPSGYWARTYVMGGGSSFILTCPSERGLAEWERQRTPRSAVP